MHYSATHGAPTGASAALFGYPKLYGQVPGGQAEYLRVPQAQFGPIKVPEGPAESGTTRAGQGQRRRHDGRRPGELGDQDELGDLIREVTEGCGPDAVIDTVGMEAHGSPAAGFAQKMTKLLPDALAAKLMENAGIHRLAALYSAIDIVRRAASPPTGCRSAKHPPPTRCFRRRWTARVKGVFTPEGSGLSPPQHGVGDRLAVVITAIVMVSCSTDSIPEVAEQIADIEAVSEVYSVAGHVDLIAIVRVRHFDDIASVIAGQISKVAGVTDTETHIAFRAYSRHDLDSAFSIGFESES